MTTEATYNSKTCPYINKCFEVSTGHITEKDDKLLKLDNVPLCAYAYDYGYFIHIPEEIDTPPTMTELTKAGFSDALLNLLQTGKRNGCKYLQLDCDGITYEDLPSFNW